MGFTKFSIEKWNQKDLKWYALEEKINKFYAADTNNHDAVNNDDNEDILNLGEVVETALKFQKKTKQYGNRSTSNDPLVCVTTHLPVTR